MVHTKESIQHLLDTNYAAVERALVVLFGRQTRDEQAMLTTRHLNQVGFDAFRAPMCSRYALWVEAGLKSGKRYGQCITSRVHQEKAHRYVRRYWRQLIAAAQAKDSASQ